MIKMRTPTIIVNCTFPKFQKVITKYPAEAKLAL